jgi:hypothetical protein
MTEAQQLNSLFVVSLPRSMSSLTYHIARIALGLNIPSWTSDGEILNVDRYAFFSGPTHDMGVKFTVEENDPALFQKMRDFLSQAAAARGFAYKDVIQPFVVSEWLRSTEFRVLSIKRNLTDVIYSMLAQKWFYPKSAARGEGDEMDLLIEGIIRADRALDATAAERVDYDDLVADESALRNALAKLYPEAAMRGFQFNSSFHKTRDSVLQRRTTDQYKMLNEKIQKAMAALEL